MEARGRKPLGKQMFSSLTDILRDNGRGVNGYRAAALKASERMQTDDENAAAWSLLAQIAEDFLDRCERMPVSSVELEEAFQCFADHAAAFDRASGRPGELIAAMNAAAQHRNGSPLS